MTGDDDTLDSLPITRRQLRLVYIAGIALNAVALVITARSGRTLPALTLGIVIVYLGLRYWLLGRS